MPKYKSYKSIITSDPIVVSFTIGQKSPSYQLELTNSTLSNSVLVNSNYSFENKDTSQYVKLQFSKDGDSLLIRNYGNQLFGNKIEIIKKATEASGIELLIDMTGNDENFIPDWDNASDGSSLFVKSNNISNVEEIYYKGLDYFIQDNSYNVIPNIAQSQETLLLISSAQSELEFLCLDYELERDLIENPLAEIITKSNGVISTQHYQSDKNINKDEHRIRFVVSDNGRTISVASWDDTDKKFNHLKSFIFPQKIQGQAFLTLNLIQHNYIKDITTNF